MPTLGLHRDFVKEFALLELGVRKRVAEALDKFDNLSAAGQHLEKLNHGRDPRLKTIRIDKFYRGVVLAPESGDSFLLLKVLPHDDAIEWALTHRASVNAATQGIELRDDVVIERISRGLDEPAPLSAPRVAGRGLLSHVSDVDLRRLGIDDAVLDLARKLDSVELLDSTRPFLPEHQHDVLVGLAAGLSVEQVWQEIVQVQLAAGLEADSAVHADGGVGPDELVAAMARAQGRIALVSGPAELLEILARPWDAWRVFLHPSQRRIAYRTSYSGSARVAGGPGTGKTVVALHRAAHLAARLPQGTPDGSVLLTTFTRDLAAELDRSLRILITDQEVLRRIRVANADALAYEVVREARGTAQLGILADQRELLIRWGRVVRRLGLDHTEAFLEQEWRHVILAQGLESAEDYLRASRSGRGTALGPVQRARVWQAVQSFTGELRQEGRLTFLQLNAEAAVLLGARSAAGAGALFRHVVVDEAQDLHPTQWRFLRAAVAQGADDLFVSGDTHQRIYGNKVSLRSLGIPVAGRSFSLRVNYRSTHEIVAWALELVAGRPRRTESQASSSASASTRATLLDDMDGGGEGLDGYRSMFHGEKPVIVGFPTKSAEVEALLEVVEKWIETGVAAEEIGIAVRFLQLGRDIAAVLGRAGIEVTVLGGAETPAGSGGVRIGTMHRMKGLEFRCMAVAGVSDGTVPMRNAVTPREVDERQHEEDLQAELSLLFVACTRAREALRVSWHGNPSPFLQPA